MLTVRLITRQVIKHFLLQNLEKYPNIKDVPLHFWEGSEKNISAQKQSVNAKEKISANYTPVLIVSP